MDRSPDSKREGAMSQQLLNGRGWLVGSRCVVLLAIIFSGVLPGKFRQVTNGTRRGSRNKIATRFALESACAILACGVLTEPTSSGGEGLARSPNLQVVRDHVIDLGPPNGRDYRRVEGLLTNTWTRADGTTGQYRAPMIMMFPVGGRPGNGVGILDVPNTAKFGFPAPR